jgi:cation diffusion facilitator family transporter
VLVWIYHRANVNSGTAQYSSFFYRFVLANIVASHHSHPFELNKNQKAIRTAIFSLLSNASLAAIKFVGGVFGNSYALIADGIESTTDVFSSLLVLFGLKYASRPPDENHPYGHGKAEPLITFAVVCFLLISATIIFTESIHNIQIPHSTPHPYTLFILLGIILFKEISYRFVHRKGKETNSTSLQADAWHHRSDAITSLLAFIGISIALIFGKGYETADDWAAMAASLFIVYNAFQIFRPALGEIMDEHFHHDLIDDIRKVADEVNGVLETEKCYVRKTGMQYFVDLHLVVDGKLSVAEGHFISHEVKDKIMAEMPDITDVLIHIEPDSF